LCGVFPDGITSFSMIQAASDAGNAAGLVYFIFDLLHRDGVIVGWTDPEGRRPYLGALLLAYHDPDKRLVYAVRAGTGIRQAELERLWRRLVPLATAEMPLQVPPPRTSRFGSPSVLSRVHWVRPELVAEVKFLTWTDDNLLRQVAYEGVREDKPATEVRREVPHRPR
jgi:ATP-dependent DNA ligase